MSTSSLKVSLSAFSDWIPGLALCCLLLALMGCSIRPAIHGLDSTLELAAPGDSVIVLRQWPGMIFRYAETRSILVGEQPETSHEWLEIGSYHPGDENIQWRLFAEEGKVELLRNNWDVILPHLKRSAKEIHGRRLNHDFHMTLNLVLVSGDVSLDATSRTIFYKNPSLTFYQFVNTTSSADIEFSLIRAIATIHHELVHFWSQEGRIDFGGQSAHEARVNEEIFAYIVGDCFRYVLLDQFQGPSFSYEISRTRQPIGDYLLNIPSIAGKILSSEIIYSILPFLDGSEVINREVVSSLATHCERIDQAPQDYIGWIRNPGNPEQERFRNNAAAHGFKFGHENQESQSKAENSKTNFE